MCNIGFHNCVACGDEIKCYQSNSECPDFNGFPGVTCEKCEYWQDELNKEEQEKEYIRKRYEEEFGFDEGD